MKGGFGEFVDRGGARSRVGVSLVLAAADVAFDLPAVADVATGRRMGAALAHNIRT